MPKNTGKPSEAIFDNHWKKYGKRAFLFKFTDASEATGLNKRVTAIKAQPCDRIVVLDGRTSFCEVKSTHHETLFEFNLLKPKQSAYAKMILAAGGKYQVYVHRLKTDEWYYVPYQYIASVKEIGRASIPWSLMEEFKCAF
jgi:penicillin-binding protein-related factor A (putative recombinase)